MTVTDKILDVYQRFYAQRSVLKGAPNLSINIDTIGIADFPTDRALEELASVASYLMGVSNLKNIPFEKQVKIVKDAYAGQTFWQNLLFDYLDLTLSVKEAQLKEEGENLADKIYLEMFNIAVQENETESLINAFAEKIKNAKFHVDAKALIRNYFKMLKKDEKKAWEVLTTNPAYFSPIQTQNEQGKVVLTPKQAIEENNKLANFLKTLKT